MGECTVWLPRGMDCPESSEFNSQATLVCRRMRGVVAWRVAQRKVALGIGLFVIVVDDRVYRIVTQYLAATQKGQLDQKGYRGDLSA